MSGRSGHPPVRVWDPLVRICHWALVAGGLAAWITRHGFGIVHEGIGYGVLAIVLLRVAWGLGPSQFARFSQFVRPPSHTLAYARDLARGRRRRYLGHNPLGGWMTVALLTTMGLVCASGWLYTTDRFWGVAWVEALHARLTDALIVLVALHVIGVVTASVHDRENLVGAMVHGRKRAPGEGDQE